MTRGLPGALLASAIASAIVMTMAMAMAALVAQPAGAHTAMLRASPDRDSVVGPAVLIDLEFLEPVTEAVVTVTYNGAPLPGRTVVADGEVITFALGQPLTQPGRHQVSYEMISFDGDFTTGGYFFTFDPGAGLPARIEPSGSPRFSAVTLIMWGVSLAVLIGGLALIARRASTRPGPVDAGMRGSAG